MAKFTTELIRKIAPRCTNLLAHELPALFNEYMPKYNINNRRRIALFLANTLTETGGFRKLEENLNYSAKRLRQVWPARFHSSAIAKRYARNPPALANFVYNRYGNKGNPGFGWKYRGSGLMMTTFIDNYQDVQRSTKLPVVEKPEMLRKARDAVLSACIYWEQHGCNELADATRITDCRKVINGGTHGLKSVKQYYGRIMPHVSNIEFSNRATKPVIVGGAGVGAITAAEQSGWNPWVVGALALAALAAFVVMVYRRKKRNEDVQKDTMSAKGIQDSADQLPDDPHRWLLMDQS